MIDGGITTIYIEDMEQSLDFYTEALGLTLTERFEDEFAFIDAGQGLTLGLRLSSDVTPPPGQVGSVMIGVYAAGPIETVKEQLEDEGVEFVSGILGGPDAPTRLAFFRDPDGNRLYLIESKSRLAERDS